MQQFNTIKTKAGMALEVNAEVNGKKITFSEMSVGDANGQPYSPTTEQTSLKHEVAKVKVNSVTQDQNDPTQWVATAILPPQDDGFTIREAGLWAEDGTLFAICDFPETYLPTLKEGASGELTINMFLRHLTPRSP